ncbi:MAG: hypothetical protein FJY56_05750 [Betaproteobacteria bacterium]|nr:hypothetical protein [Betaproteobacteria bacterium]
MRSNIWWSAFGTIVPLLAAVVAIPPLIKAMGDARFGVLSLAWVLVGYFGFFDLGLGRALTHFIARQSGDGKEEKISAIVRSGITLRKR